MKRTGCLKKDRVALRKSLPEPEFNTEIDPE